MTEAPTRPECVLHSECPGNLACLGEKCRDPCPGACGPAAECEVINHKAVCRCQQGYEGDPFTGCRRITTREYSTIIIYSSVSMQLQLVYQHHPSKIPKLNIKSINGCNHGNIYLVRNYEGIKVHFEKYLRYIVYGTYISNIIMVIMKGIARVIDKSTRYFFDSFIVGTNIVILKH